MAFSMVYAAAAGLSMAPTLPGCKVEENNNAMIILMAQALVLAMPARLAFPRFRSVRP